MSRKLEVLRMLEAAGPRGVRSDEFYRRFNGRGVARIWDLRQEGYDISDEREGKYKRYVLNVGVGAEGSDQPRTEGLAERASLSAKTLSTDSGVEASVPISRPSGGTDAPPANPYDPWVQEAA